MNAFLTPLALDEGGGVPAPWADGGDDPGVVACVGGIEDSRLVGLADRARLGQTEGVPGRDHRGAATGGVVQIGMISAAQPEL